MGLDLTQFHETFFQESFEALDNMEAALLQLSSGEPNSELVNTIFRVAHSIKGGSATFGFTEIAAFTHTAETLLDQLRSGKRQIDDKIVDVFLRSVDVMRGMLSATQNHTDIDTQQVADLHAELEQIMNGAVTAASPPPVEPVKSQVSPVIDVPHISGWRINFAPGPQMMKHGNDPVRMLKELASLGQLACRVNANKLPPLADLDPEVCQLSWQLELRTDADRQAIEQVFEWAEGECELNIEPLTPTPSAPVASPVSAPQPVTTAVTEPAPVAVSQVTPDAVIPVTPPVAVASVHAPSAPTKDASRSPVVESSSIRVSIEKVDELLNSVGELVITQSVLSQLTMRLEGELGEQLKNNLAQLERHTRALQDSVMRVRMLPIATVFNRFPRMIHELGHRLGKKLELKMHGDHTELDKTVLEKIGDPLVHLVRNSVDHGIEMPEKRLASGKVEHGTIELNAYHKGGNVFIEVTDDGGGLDCDRILSKARERGLVGADEILSEEEIMNLIFMPGFSTAEVVSDVSGRGVGMDVVRRNINEIGGNVQISSVLGQGSTVRIRLPLTLAILDGQLVRVGPEIYVVPIVSIVESIQIKSELVSSVANGPQLFRLRDEYVPIVRLHELFEVMSERTPLTDGLLMIVEADGKRIGLFVDELQSQQQVVIKSLETNFHGVSGLSGATMLGDGQVALILDIPGVITKSIRQKPMRDIPKEVA